MCDRFPHGFGDPRGHPCGGRPGGSVCGYAVDTDGSMQGEHIDVYKGIWAWELTPRIWPATGQENPHFLDRMPAHTNHCSVSHTQDRVEHDPPGGS